MLFETMPHKSTMKRRHSTILDAETAPDDDDDVNDGSAGFGANAAISVLSAPIEPSRSTIDIRFRANMNREERTQTASGYRASSVVAPTTRARSCASARCAPDAALTNTTTETGSRRPRSHQMASSTERIWRSACSAGSRAQPSARPAPAAATASS